MSMSEMTKEELNAFYKDLEQIIAKGNETEMRSYISEYLPRLPEGVRDELIVNELYTAVQVQLQEERTIAQIQETGLGAANALKEFVDESKQNKGLT